MKKVITATVGALALWEAGSTWLEARNLRNGREHWRKYYTARDLERADALRETHTLVSTGVTLLVDVFAHPDPQAPVLIFNHGGGGYSRMFQKLALMMHDLGYAVVLTNQRGQGLSGGRRGDYTVAECVKNIVDVADWAGERFRTRIFMAGGSLGGGLTYYAAAAGAPVDAIACLNLFDFGNGIDGLGCSRLAPLTRFPRLSGALCAMASLLKPLGRLRIPLNWLGVMEKIMDGREPEFQTLWEEDPCPNRYVALRTYISLISTPPAKRFEDNAIPTLVINQAQDEMTDPAVTRRNFARLGGPKRYREIPFGHFSNTEEFYRTIADACHAWFSAHEKR